MSPPRRPRAPVTDSPEVFRAESRPSPLPASPPAWSPAADAALAWFAEHRRDLPWRRTRDPYGIWVSEVMLQQTRVETVRAYWTRWMNVFPTVATLAAAPQDEVMSLWQGLGYYRRARLLHEGARMVMERFQGVLPSDAATLGTLPGIGRYTAGAIASIAFDEQAPLVDGNVMRVMGRMAAVGVPMQSAAARKAVWKWAAVWVRGPAPGDRNQALMELGATVCTPRSPSCGICPVRRWCAACAAGTPEAWPVAPEAKTASPVMARWVLLAGAAEAPQWWAQRPADGLWGGLWDLPMGPPSEALAAWLQEVRAVEGPAVRHVLTHRRVDATLWRVPPGAAKPRPDWLDPYDTWWEGGPALPPHSRLMQRLREEASQGTLPLG